MKALEQLADFYDEKGKLTTQVLLLFEEPRRHWLRDIGTRLTTKSSGKAFPPEVWNMVAGLLESERFMLGWSPVIVQKASKDVDDVSTVEVKEIRLPLWERSDTSSTRQYEHMLANYKVEHEDWEIKPPTNPRTVVFPLDCSEKKLYGKVTSPDIVSRIERGRCWFCSGTRNICPGCTGGIAQEFDCFMGCGVDLACPNCMGLDFAWQDKEFLQKYYWEEAPEEEERARSKRLLLRYVELGYNPEEYGFESKKAA